MDIRINLIALGSTLAFQCECHTKHHNDGETREKFLATVAAREKTTPEEITEVIYLLRRLIKPSQRDLEQGLQSLSASAADLALRMIT